MGERIEHVVEAHEQGMRLDALVAGLDEERIASRSAAVRMIEAAQVLVNGEASTKKRLVVEGDVIEIDAPARTGEGADITPDYTIPLDIRFEDEHLIVLSKQPGLCCHPSRGHWDGTLANALVAHCGISGLAAAQGEDRPGIIHRLDMDTSGLMLAAKTDQAAAKLQEAIRIRDVDRRYLTLVHGYIAPDTGMVDAPIARDSRERMRMKVSDDLSARPSVTTFTVLERFEPGRYDEGYTLLECKLYTGRTHQIRVHMSYINHPVVGDQLYGRAANAKAKHRDAALRAERGLERQFLHSHKVDFSHPVSSEALSFVDELPEDLADILMQIAPQSMGRTDAGRAILGD